MSTVSRNALFQNSQTHSVNDSIKDFDWLVLQISVKNCIVGMLSTYNIPSLFQCMCHRVFICEYLFTPIYREYMSGFMVWVQFSISDSDPNPINYVALYFRYDEGQCFCLIACILGFSVRSVSQ